MPVGNPVDNPVCEFLQKTPTSLCTGLPTVLQDFPTSLNTGYSQELFSLISKQPLAQLGKLH
jgi:hypothetical protein